MYIIRFRIFILADHKISSNTPNIENREVSFRSTFLTTNSVLMIFDVRFYYQVINMRVVQKNKNPIQVKAEKSMQVHHYDDVNSVFPPKPKPIRVTPPNIIPSRGILQNIHDVLIAHKFIIGKIFKNQSFFTIDKIL